MSTARSDAAKAYAKAPYTKEYGAIWADVKDLKGIVTKSELVQRMQKRTGKSETACSASVGVILSPRETSKGDCRGNASAKGHLYYFDKLNRKVDKNGQKDEQRFRFHWRKEILPVKTRKSNDSVESTKVAPSVTAPVAPVATSTEQKADVEATA
jgi:hypothetical protein